MEIEDELEAEFDVIYSGEYQNEVALMQFPLIPSKNFKESTISSLRINKEGTQMILEKNLDINYLDSRSPLLKTTDSMIGQKIEPDTNHLIGIFKKDKLYLTPCCQIFQFKHDFAINEEDKRDIQIKKKELKKKEIVQTNKDKEEDFINLIIHKSNSIESYSKIEKITDPEKIPVVDPNLILSPEEYKNLLLKYVNDKSITDILNEKAIPPDWEEHPMLKRKNNNNITNSKEREENQNKMEIENEIDYDNNNHTNNNHEEHNNTSNIVQNDEEMEGTDKDDIIYNQIRKMFAQQECWHINYLMEELIKNLGIDKNGKDSNRHINKIKKEIDIICYKAKNNCCFLREAYEDNEVNQIRQMLLEYIDSSEGGVKKQQIKQYLKNKDIVLQDNKLNKILKTISIYSDTVWKIKDS